MRLEYQTMLAVGLDLALGDPRWLPHPVRGLGWLALRLEILTRRLIPARLAGAATALAVYVIAGGAAWGVIHLAGLADPLAADAMGVVVIYTTLAARDLVGHSMAVHGALAEGNLVEARRRLGAIVGRDTDDLDETGIARATVESVAESTVDGVTAPLLFALVGGPVAAMVYRAINTLDSMFGHQDERYRLFGWAAARCDDVANYLPARLTAPVMVLAACFLGQRPWQAWRILVRDGRRHASPNAGLPEAAMAGALGVQLGGPCHYDGQLMDKPAIGDPGQPLRPRHIILANALMLVTLALILVCAVAIGEWRVASGE